MGRHGKKKEANKKHNRSKKISTKHHNGCCIYCVSEHRSTKTARAFLVTKLGEERVFDKPKMGGRERERERESRKLIIEGAFKPLSNVNQIAHLLGQKNARSPK
jgi:hypothetical protein